jgi:hypothetical protein
MTRLFSHCPANCLSYAFYKRLNTLDHVGMKRIVSQFDNFIRGKQQHAGFALDIDSSQVNTGMFWIGFCAIY